MPTVDAYTALWHICEARPVVAQNAVNRHDTDTIYGYYLSFFVFPAYDTVTHLASLCSHLDCVIHSTGLPENTVVNDATKTEQNSSMLKRRRFQSPGTDISGR